MYIHVENEDAGKNSVCQYPVCLVKENKINKHKNTFFFLAILIGIYVHFFHLIEINLRSINLKGIEQTRGKKERERQTESKND